MQNVFSNLRPQPCQTYALLSTTPKSPRSAKDSSHITSITGAESTILETGYSWNERGHFAEMITFRVKGELSGPYKWYHGRKVSRSSTISGDARRVGMMMQQTFVEGSDPTSHIGTGVTNAVRTFVDASWRARWTEVGWPGSCPYWG